MTKSGYSRRDFLKVIGAGSGLAATGCGKDLPEKLIPYVVQPEEVIPGVALWYAGSCGECSSSCGTMVRVRDGRATKSEGNPKHPLNKGGLCAIGQSSIQAHYDPDRIREPLKRDIKGPFKTVKWVDAVTEVAEALKAGASKDVLLVTQPLTGSVKTLIGELKSKIPNLKHIQFDVLGNDTVNEASKQTFGDGVVTHFDFSKADVVVGFGADYLESWVSPVEFSRQWAEGRQPKAGPDGKASMTYTAHIEPRLSPTAAVADKWVMNKPGSEAYLLSLLLKLVLDKKTGQLPAALASKLKNDLAPFTLADVEKKSGVTAMTVTALADRLVAAKRSLIVAGGTSCSAPFPVECGVLANLLNAALGNIGTSVILRSGEKGVRPAVQELYEICEAVVAGKKTLGAVIISGANPVYTLPSSHPFKKALAKADIVVGISGQLDETTNYSNIVLPISTNFESWNDSEPAPGVYNLNQPAMSPLYETLSLGDALLAIGLKLEFSINGVKSFEDYIKRQWKKRTGEAGFDARWDQYVEQGGDYLKPDLSSLTPSFTGNAPDLKKVIAYEQNGPMLLAFPHTLVGDGRGSNRPWLQEIPYPLTTSVWGSWIEINPKTAEKYGVGRKDVIDIHTEGGKVQGPTYYSKYIHEDLIAVPMGYGHEAYGRYAAGVGENVVSTLVANASDVGVSYLVPLKAEKVTVDDRTKYETKFKPIQTTIYKDNLVIFSGNRDEPSDSQLGRGITRTVPLSQLTLKGAAGLGAVKLSQSGFEHGGSQSEGHAGHHGHEEVHGDEHHGKGHHDPFALGPQEEPKQMYHQMDHPLYRWGMTIDLNSCTGCSACVVACYAENNIAVVGKEICNQGREMSWLRMERYFDGDEDQPLGTFLPMLCQHCNNAPCEPVCPVYATYHNEDGINSTVYNRCVGTRYCSNNCSYKVRRFNWFKYEWPEPLTWQLNPDVTVRSVGVIEKCNFCHQRIVEAKNNAKNEGRVVRDGEIKVACEATCATGAIKFGNLLDKNSGVYADTQNERSYKILDSFINTQPAITYFARVKHDGQPVQHALNDNAAGSKNSEGRA